MKLVDIFNKIYTFLPSSWQYCIMKLVYYFFTIYYTAINQFPYNKARHRIAYYEKFCNSKEYTELLSYFGNYEAVKDIYFSERWWKHYMRRITFKEKLKCFFTPYSIIDKYNSE